MADGFRKGRRVVVFVVTVPISDCIGRNGVALVSSVARTVAVHMEVEMKVETSRLVSLQTLCARLRVLLSLFEHEGALGGRCSWSGVANLLLPAACVTRVETNAAAADLYDAGLYCEPAAGYDERQSRILDDYMSALARYHFVWNAYETVRNDSDAGRMMKTKNAADRETLAAKVPGAHLELLDRVCRPSRSLTQGSPEVQEWLKTKGVETHGLGKAGRLATGFRNYLFHGDEAPPAPDDWDDQFRTALDGDEAITLHSYRLTSFTRLTLHLMQALAHAELRRGYGMEVTDIPFLSRWVDAEFELPCAFVLNLASCWPEERGLALSSKAVTELAAGCDVPAKSVDLVVEIAEEAG